VTNSSLSAESAAIVLQGVSKHYGSVHAVDGVDLTVQRGELFGLIGHNGAGKSTLFKMMLGLIPASTRCTIHVAGASVQGPDFRIARRKIGYLPENLVLYDNLTALETMRFFAKLKGADVGTVALLCWNVVGLGDVGQRAVHEFSKGMRQRLGFAQALLGQPRVLFLDEPSNGLDPGAIRDFYAQLRELRGKWCHHCHHLAHPGRPARARRPAGHHGQRKNPGYRQRAVPCASSSTLPLSIALRVEPALLPELQSHMRAIAGASVQVTSGVVVIHCPRPAKMAVLAALAPLSAQLVDLHIHEPSLEDLFFGLRS
jgi:Cu-processing system ATP-binding protein